MTCRSHAGVLEATQNHFKAPPQFVLEVWDPVKLLDSLPFDKADVYSGVNITLVSDIQQADELRAAVSALRTISGTWALQLAEGQAR